MRFFSPRESLRSLRSQVRSLHRPSEISTTYQRFRKRRVTVFSNLFKPSEIAFSEKVRKVARALALAALVAIVSACASKGARRPPPADCSVSRQDALWNRAVVELGEEIKRTDVSDYRLRVLLLERRALLQELLRELDACPAAGNGKGAP
jgi:hypothetical protein